MIRAALVVLLLCASCTVPSLEELRCESGDIFSVEGVSGGGDDATCTSLRVTVSYEGFKPGCVRVLARDVSGDNKALSKDMEAKGVPTGGSLVVGIVPPENWSTSVKVEAQAFERTCTGAPVVTNSKEITTVRGETTATTLQLLAMDKDADGYVSRLSGGTDCNDDRSDINPGVTVELCNGVDDNCNDRPDTVELQLGQSCTEGASCEGARACGDNGKVVCNVPSATLAYPDVDGDGHGDKNTTATAFCNGVPAGFVTGPNDDCDDSAANVFPGADELCDGKNNDCDAQTDEGYPGLNTACTDPATQCGGTLQCNASGTATACVVPQPVPTWYPDGDGDGYGRNAGSQQTCVQPAGAYVSQGDDCDDGNRFTYRNAPELCDGLDNDCDTLPEGTAVCPAGGPTWGERTEGSSTQLWTSVSTWTPGGVWVVGDNNRRAVMKPGDTSFNVTTGGCGTSSTGWNAVWADLNNNGRAYFLSSGGRFARQDTASTDCTQVTDSGLENFGITGFQTNSVLELYGVSSNSSAGEGAAFQWDGVSNTAIFNPASNGIAYVYDVHGTSRDTLFAVGGYDPTPPYSPGPRIYRYKQLDGTWQTMNVQTSTPGLARLNGVWVVNDKLAFAVGQSGSAARWNGAVWSKLTFPTTDNLTSVVAFGANSAYATSNNGRIYRFNGTDWTQLHELAGTTFRDIAGTSPADLWVVGSNGKILHWPQ